MTTIMATMPAAAHAICRTRKPYGEPKRSFAITAEALKTITSPMKTSNSVTVNSHLSTLTRLAIIHCLQERRFPRVAFLLLSPPIAGPDL